jgi:flagellar biosynthesis/type III secretory pathway protein FliH
MAISRKIIKQELQLKRDTISKNLDEALRLAIRNEEYHITLNPEDLALVEEIQPQLIATIRDLEHIVILTDPAITPGGCMVESQHCTVDATIEGQLEAAELFLEDHVGEQEIPKDQGDTPKK